MEEKEKKTVEILSKEMVEKVINSINEAEAVAPVQEGSNLDMNKVKEVISSLEGCTAHTVVGILSTALLLLPAGAIMAVMDMGKKAFTAKALGELMGMVKAKCPDCECSEDAEASEAPEE